MGALTGPLLYGVAGGALLLLVGIGVQTYRLTLAQTDVAVARQHQAEAEGVAAKVNEIFARNEADQERRRAEQVKANSDELLRITNERDAIETRFKNVSADRSKLSAENRRLIANAPKTDSVLLGPTMRTYFSRLRVQQQASRSSSLTTSP